MDATDVEAIIMLVNLEVENNNNSGTGLKRGTLKNPSAAEQLAMKSRMNLGL